MNPRTLNRLLGAFIIGIFLVSGFWLFMNRDQETESASPIIANWHRCYFDRDQDGHGSQEIGYEGGGKCPPDFPPNSDDCDDDRDDVHPRAEEICDGIDNDCDRLIDEGVAPFAFYRDADGDGHGIIEEQVTGCVLPEGYALEPGDPDDTDPNVPEVQETEEAQGRDHP